jgi:hypothetical protein
MALPGTLEKIKSIRAAQLANRANGYVFVKTNPMLLKKKK